MRTEKLRAVLVGLAVMLIAGQGCGDGVGSAYPSMTWGPASNSLFKPGSSSTSGLLGDWFGCKDAGCNTLGDDGFRFAGDGSWSALDARGSSLEPGESYCEEQRASQRGTYTISGNTLTMKVHSGTARQQLTFQMLGANTARVTITLAGHKEPQTIDAFMRRVVPTRSSGPCQEDPIPVPMP